MLSGTIFIYNGTDNPFLVILHRVVFLLLIMDYKVTQGLCAKVIIINQQEFVSYFFGMLCVFQAKNVSLKIALGLNI